MNALWGILGAFSGLVAGFLGGFLLAGWCYRKGIRDALLISGVGDAKRAYEDAKMVLKTPEEETLFPVKRGETVGNIL